MFYGLISARQDCQTLSVNMTSRSLKVSKERISIVRNKTTNSFLSYILRILNFILNKEILIKSYNLMNKCISQYSLMNRVFLTVRGRSSLVGVRVGRGPGVSQTQSVAVRRRQIECIRKLMSWRGD